MKLKSKVQSYYEAFKNADTFVKILVGLILLGPIIDILTSVGKREIGLDLSLGILLKGIFLVYVSLKILFAKTKNKAERLIRIALFIIIGYGAVHFSVVYFYYGRGFAVGSVVTLAKTFYLPILMLGLIHSLQRKDIEWVRASMVLSALIIMGSMAISVLTGTGYDAYKYNKLGTVGWFFAANEVSAFIGILTPIVLYYILHKLKTSIALKVLLLGSYIYLYYQIGTKVVGLSVLLISLFLLFFLLIAKFWRKEKKVFQQGAVLVIMFIMGISFIPITPVGFNMNIHLDIIENIPEPSQEEPGDTENDDFEDGFNMEEVLLNNPKVLSFIFSGRDRYFAVRRYLYREADSVQKILGLSQFAPNDEGEVNSYIIEIDFLDIYFNYGIVGSLLYWGMIFSVLGVSIYRVVKRKLLFEQNGVILYDVCAIFLSMGIAMFAGHVYVSPSVSIYIALYIALLYKETEHTSEEDPRMEIV